MIRLVSVSKSTCLCGYEHVDFHRTADRLYSYCQNCGRETSEVKPYRAPVLSLDDRRAAKMQQQKKRAPKRSLKIGHK